MNDRFAPSRRPFGSGGAGRATSGASATEDHDQQQHRRQEKTTKRHVVTAADFVRVIRTLLWLSPTPTHATSAASETAWDMTGTTTTTRVRVSEADETDTPEAVAATAQQADEGDPSQILGGRDQAKRWEPRTSLDLSGHSFGKVLQVGFSVYSGCGTVATALVCLRSCAYCCCVCALTAAGRLVTTAHVNTFLLTRSRFESDASLLDTLLFMGWRGEERERCVRCTRTLHARFYCDAPSESAPFFFCDGGVI